MQELKTASPARGPWGPGSTIGFTLVIAGGFAIAQVAVAVPYVLLTAGENSMRAATAALGSDGLFLALAEVCSGAAALGLTLLFARLRKGPSVQEYLAFTRMPRMVVLRWLLYTILLGVALEGVTRMTGYESVPEWMVVIYDSAGSLPLLVLAVLAVAPIVEEVVFRGFLFEGLRHSWLGDAGTTVLTSLVWAGLHTQYEAVYVGEIFCLGLLLGAARVRTASLLAPIAMHALFGGVGLLQLALGVR